MRSRNCAVGISLLLLSLSLAGCIHSRISPEGVLVAERIDATTFRFSALDSRDPDGVIVSVEWNFGDGTTETGAARTHEYATPGDYTVSLEVTDDNGLTATQEIVVTAYRKILVPGDCPTIQQAIDGASNGDLILLGEQTFTEYISFRGKAITVCGVSQTGTTLRRPPITEGAGPASIVTFDSGETRDAVLGNLTIQGDPWSVFGASAIRIVEASPTVRDCIISSHSATFGGAVSVHESAALFEGNQFLDNLATVDGGAVNVEGTGAFPDFVNNEFTGNMANAGGAVCLRTRNDCRLAIDAKLSTIAGNTFSSNRALGSPAAAGLTGAALHVGCGVRIVLGENAFSANIPNDVVYEDVGL
jgi:PKD repeat protein